VPADCEVRKQFVPINTSVCKRVSLLHGSLKCNNRCTVKGVTYYRNCFPFLVILNIEAEHCLVYFVYEAVRFLALSYGLFEAFRAQQKEGQLQYTCSSKVLTVVKPKISCIHKIAIFRKVIAQEDVTARILCEQLKKEVTV